MKKLKTPHIIVFEVVFHESGLSFFFNYALIQYGAIKWKKNMKFQEFFFLRLAIYLKEFYFF